MRFRQNADSAILNREPHDRAASVPTCQTHVNPDVALRGELHRIPTQIQEYLANTHRIPDHFVRNIRLPAHRDLDSLFRGAGREQVRYFHDHGFQIEGTRLDLELSRFNL